MKKKATHKFFPNGKQVGETVSACLNNMVWVAGSHGVLPPNMNVTPPFMLTPTDRMMVKNSVCNILLDNEASWQLILVAAFDNDKARSYVTADIQLNQWTLAEVGEKIMEICEVTIRKMEEVFYGEGAVNLTAVHHYGYMLSPTQGLNTDVIEERLIDALQTGSFEHYDWKSRPKITPKNFIDSIAALKF